METPPPPDKASQQAKEYLNRAASLKSQGQFDAALTEYRRAVLADPSLFEAHLEVGRLYREKAKSDPLFFRFSFEAFQKAARMDLSHEKAHDGYIAAGQKVGRLEELYEDYKTLSDQNPQNENLKRCVNNLRQLLLAQMPSSVGLHDAGFTAKTRKMLFIMGLGAFLFGLALITSPYGLKILTKQTLGKEQTRGVVKTGMVLEVVALGIFLSRGLFK